MDKSTEIIWQGISHPKLEIPRWYIKKMSWLSVQMHVFVIQPKLSELWISFIFNSPSKIVYHHPPMQKRCLLTLREELKSTCEEKI